MRHRHQDHDNKGHDTQYFNMRTAGAHLGQSYRWMQRNYVYLVREGVIAFRVPKDSPKGHLMFERSSLDRYMELCRIKADLRPLGDLPKGQQSSQN